MSSILSHISPKTLSWLRYASFLNFSFLFSVSSTFNEELSRHEQVYLMRLSFRRYFSYHRAMQVAMLHIFKESMQTWREKIELADLGIKLNNATN